MTEIDIPLLGPGRELTQATSQTVMAIGSALRERRFALGRYAWSDDRAAERVVEDHRRAADPPVREMNEAEFDLFRRDGRAGEPGYDTRETRGSHGQVRVTVGPMPEGRGWGVVAEAVAPDEPRPDRPGAAPTPVQAQVVAKSETEAKELADELLAGGHSRVQRLHEFGQDAARRATQARTEVRETREQLVQRTADAVRHVWQSEPELAERMIRPSAAELQTGQTTNGALGALAHELEKLEDRGYDMVDVLTRIDRTHALRGARNPAAMACSFVQRLAPDLQVINLDDEQPAPERQADAQDRQADRTGPPSESLMAAEEALQNALGGSELAVESVRQAPGYPRLRTLLAEQHAQGRDLDPLMTGLPTRRVAGADDPAAYLRAVIESRVTASAPRRSRPDLYASAQLVERCLPRDASRAVIGCDSWPGLAARLDRWRAEGLPVTTMLESLPADRIRTATNPAHYMGLLLNAKATSHRKQYRAAAGGRQETGNPDWSTEPDTVEPPARAHRAPAPSIRPDVEGTPQTTEPEQLSGARSIDGDIHQLDPASAVDRVALRAARGSGDPERDQAIERLLALSAAGRGQQPSSENTVDAHADKQFDRAQSAERAAAHAATTPDDLGTASREDLVGQDRAHAADEVADRARAIAESDTSTAAAARARLSYWTPERGAGPSTGTGAARPTTPPHAVPARRVVPSPRPVPGPGPRR